MNNKLQRIGWALSTAYDKMLGSTPCEREFAKGNREVQRDNENKNKKYFKIVRCKYDGNCQSQPMLILFDYKGQLLSNINCLTGTQRNFIKETILKNQKDLTKVKGCLDGKYMNEMLRLATPEHLNLVRMYEGEKYFNIYDFMHS